MSKRQYRNICFTVNNYTDDQIKALDGLAKQAQTGDLVRYIVWGLEQGEEGTPHIQGYIEFMKKMVGTKFQKLLGTKCHLEPRKGKAAEAAGYCKKGSGDKPKEGWQVYFNTPHKTWQGEEAGLISDQGKRADLDEIQERIKGGVSVKELRQEDPYLYHEYGRTMDKLEDDYLSGREREEMTKGVWYFGKTGVGKTHKAIQLGKEAGYYMWADDGGWQDCYEGQHTVILNDFRGKVAYNELLQMVDKFPYSVRRRCRAPMPFTSKRVIITSSLSPAQVYNKREAEDSLEQLLRRFEVVEIISQTETEAWVYDPSTGYKCDMYVDPI